MREGVKEDEPAKVVDLIFRLRMRRKRATIS